MTAAEMTLPEFPKPLVKVTRHAGSFDCDLRAAADADAVAAAEAAGFVVVEAGPDPSFQEFPKWLYKAGGDRRVVHTHDEQEKLGGDWVELPPDEEEPKARA